MTLVTTGSQTVGPFFHIGLKWLFHDDMSKPAGGSAVTTDSTAERVAVRGRVIDGDGNGVPDAMVEIWQPDTGGFARLPTDADGVFAFTAAKAGHLNVTIFMRGLLRHLQTRMYFQDEAVNADDPILRLVERSRRETLIARRTSGSPHELEWNIVLQGQDETVFFEW